MAQYARIQPETFRARIMQIGVTSVIFAIGFAMTGYINFWRGIFLMSIIIAIYLGNLWLLEKKITSREKGLQTAVLIVSYGVLLWFVFVSAPLDVLIADASGNYAADTDVFGFKWKSEYYPINVRIYNDTDSDYGEFDAYVRTSNSIAGIVKPKNSLNQCVFEAGFGPTGLLVAFPEISSSGMLVTPPSFNFDVSTFYHIRCDHIPIKFPVELIVVATPGKPEWAAIQAHYMAAGRYRDPYFPQCFAALCPHMPTTYEKFIK
jgi:hypothetical protein